MQMGFYFDQTQCIGCYACEIACKDWHDVEMGPVGYRHITYIEKGRYPNPYVAYMSDSCYHCTNPDCATACPADAISKRNEDGIIVVDREACLGRDECGACLEACPYDIPRFGEEENAKMQKCDFCLDRLTAGKDPICVGACPSRCLDFGALPELTAKYGNSREAEGFSYLEQTQPSVIFKKKIK